MSDFQLFGQPVMTLTEVVDNLMIAQGNVKRNHYLSYLIHAKWAWKKLLWNTVFNYTTKIVNVEDQKITLPNDMLRLVSITVMDECHNMQPVMFNPNMFTMEVSCPTNTCSCNTCKGEGTLCGVLDNIQFRTEDVVINGVTYQKKTWNRVDGEGNLQEVSSIPVYNATTTQVEFITQYITQCKLETFDNNCLKPTERNRELIKTHCGCYLFLCQDKGCNLLDFRRHSRVDLKTFDNGYGYWKYDEIQKNLVHLRHTKAEKLIITYQTSGDTGHAELLVPEFTIDAMMLGIVYRQKLFSEVASRLEKEGAKKDYDRAVFEVNKFMNPVSITNILNIQTEIPLW